MQASTVLSLPSPSPSLSTKKVLRLTASSSIVLSQLLSRPSQLSGSGVGALQALSPSAVQTRVPSHWALTHWVAAASFTAAELVSCSGGTPGAGIVGKAEASARVIPRKNGLYGAGGMMARKAPR